MRNRRTAVACLLLWFAGVTAQAQQNALPPPQAPNASPKQTEQAPAVIAVPVVPQKERANGPVQKSVCRITTTAVEPDYKAPWNAGAIGRGIGAGFVIEDLLEPLHSKPDASVGEFGHRATFIAPYVRIKARRRTDAAGNAADGASKPKVWVP